LILSYEFYIFTATVHWTTIKLLLLPLVRIPTDQQILGPPTKRLIMEWSNFVDLVYQEISTGDLFSHFRVPLKNERELTRHLGNGLRELVATCYDLPFDSDELYDSVTYRLGDTLYGAVQSHRQNGGRPMKRKGSTKTVWGWLKSIMIVLFIYALMSELLPLVANRLQPSIGIPVAMGMTLVVFCLVRYTLKKLGMGRE
jgi:hypothetical protein